MDGLLLAGVESALTSAQGCLAFQELPPLFLERGVRNGRYLGPFETCCFLVAASERTNKSYKATNMHREYVQIRVDLRKHIILSMQTYKWPKLRMHTCD